MSNVVDIDDYRPHLVSELICIMCYHRWIAVYPEEVLLKDIECSKCKQKGFVIATGQVYREEDEEDDVW